MTPFYIMAKRYIFWLQDFVPSHDVNAKDRYEMSDRVPENGGLSPRFTRTRTQNPSTSCSGGSGAAHNGVDNFERQFMRVLQKVYQTIEKNEMRLAEQDRRDIIKLEWQQVALVVDRLLLVAFFVVTAGVTLGLMMSSPLSRSFLLGSAVDPDVERMLAMQAAEVEAAADTIEATVDPTALPWSPMAIPT